MNRWACSAAIVLVACGCGDPEGPGAQLELGGASADRTRYVAVDDGAEVPLVPGSQGGFHVWTGVRVHGAAGILYLEREARRVSDGLLVLLSSTTVLEVPDAAMEDWWEHPHGDGDALPSFMCPPPLGVTIPDEPLLLRAQIFTEEEELVAEDELTFVPRCPDGDQSDFCTEICSS
jgi:hypothetical protein